MTFTLGAIADDFTGATDLANNLVRSGMRTVQVIGVPSLDEIRSLSCDAVVVALKSRSAPVAEAVEESRRSAAALIDAGAEHLYFKYCSTFDSTPEGNIGPVIDALLETTGSSETVAVPAFPEAGRTVYQGHLFVGNHLLNETGMRNHPLTPMRDANIVRVLQAQTKHRVGLIDTSSVRAGAQATRRALEELLHDSGARIAVVDAVGNDDLAILGSAFGDLRLVTGGSGLALGLAAAWGFERGSEAGALPAASGHEIILAGSVSQATRGQVEAFIATGSPSFALDLEQLRSGVDVVPDVLSAVERDLGRGPVLIYSTQSPEAVAAFQDQVGAERASALIEDALGRIARELVHRGTRAIVVAGGETSGAVVKALGVRSLQIGPQIDPGVPWCATVVDGVPIHIALKSGNFGSTDFFTRAFAELKREDQL